MLAQVVTTSQALGWINNEYSFSLVMIPLMLIYSPTIALTLFVCRNDLFSIGLLTLRPQ